MIAVLLVAIAGLTPRSAEAQLIVNSGTATISTGTSVSSVIVAQNPSDVATLTVTPSGSLSSTGYLSVGNGGTGTLNVTGGSVTNSYGCPRLLCRQFRHGHGEQRHVGQ